MNEVLLRGNVIKRIREGKELETIAAYAREQVFKNGPKDTLVLEILEGLWKNISPYMSVQVFVYITRNRT